MTTSNLQQHGTWYDIENQVLQNILLPVQKEWIFILIFHYL